MTAGAIHALFGLEASVLTSLAVVTLGGKVCKQFLTTVTLGLNPRVHSVISRHSQTSSFAPIAGCVHGSALRLSEDDR